MKTKNLLVLEGDSLVSPAGDKVTLPSAMKKYLGGQWQTIDMSRDGSSLNSIKERAADVDALFCDAERNELVVWCGTANGYEGAETASQKMIAYLEARKARGWKLTFINMLDRQETGLPSWDPDMETYRRDYNALVGAWCDENGVRVLVTDPCLENSMDPTWYRTDPPGVHLNSDGEQVVADQLNVLIQ